MSKAELPGGQGLEEILASIRKSLAEKATGTIGQARSEPTPPQPATDGGPEAGPAAGASNRAAMPQRVTGVLNGKGSAAAGEPAAADPGAAEQGSPAIEAATATANGRAHGYPPVEPSLADLLADVAAPPPTKRSAQPAAASKQDPAESDPLWFLGSKAAKPEGLAAAERAPAVAPGEAKTPAAPAGASSGTQPAPDDVKLTQPEALRRSFPPLFGVSAETPLARAAMPAPDQDPIPVSAVEAFVQRIKAPFFETPGNGRTRSEAPATPKRSQPAGEALPTGDVVPMPAAAARAAEVPEQPPEQPPEQSPEQPLEKPPEKPQEQPQAHSPEHLSGQPSEQISKQPSAHPSEQATAAGSMAPDVELAPPVEERAPAEVVGTVPAPVVAPLADAPLQPEPATAKFPFNTSPAARRAEEPTPAAAIAAPGSAPGLSPLPPTQGLQAAIAQLLEPVLRQWVEITLPRLVETAIREEVTRQLSKPSGELKI